MDCVHIIRDQQSRERERERALFIYAFMSLQDHVMYSSLYSMIMENGCCCLSIESLYVYTPQR